MWILSAVVGLVLGVPVLHVALWLLAPVAHPSPPGLRSALPFNWRLLVPWTPLYYRWVEARVDGRLS